MLTLHSGGVINVPLLSDLTQLVNDGTLLRRLVIDVLSDNWVEKVVIAVEFFYTFFVEED